MGKTNQLIFDTAFSTYHHVSQIGVGGAGVVVKAQDEDGNIFAIKYLSPENTSEEKVKRFKNELSFCAANKHPNILTVLEWGSVELRGRKCPFYVMPYYEGTLRSLLKESIPASRVLHHFSQILDGVEAAHLQRVWHRDLKPENVLYDRVRDALVVADFGIARFAEPMLQTLVETQPNVRLANFQYAAPEQREREAIVDHRADIYALGLILNEMFTGKLALGVGFKRISSVSRDHSYLDSLIDMMLGHSPDHRPGSIAEIKQQLIGRQNDFVVEQKLSRLRGTVIPKSDIDDPLVDNPPELVDVKWEGDRLLFTLSQPVNPNWVRCFYHPGSHSAILGHGPDTFQFSGNTAMIWCDADVAQRIVGYTKQYVKLANNNYKIMVEGAAREQKAKEERELRKRIEDAERTKAINASLKL